MLEIFECMFLKIDKIFKEFKNHGRSKVHMEEVTNWRGKFVDA